MPLLGEVQHFLSRLDHIFCRRDPMSERVPVETGAPHLLCESLLDVRVLPVAQRSTIARIIDEPVSRE